MANRGSVARFFSGGDGVLPGQWRLVVIAMGCVLPSGVYLATESKGWQVVSMFALVFLVLPVLAKRYGVRDEFADAVGDASPPVRLFLAAVILVAPWGALCWVLVPTSLGPWLWFWLVMMPWLEAFMWLAERSRARHGTESWAKPRPLRDSAAAGAATAPIIFLLAVTDDTPVGESVLTGLLCGVIVFAGAGAFAVLHRRAATGYATSRNDE